MSKQKKTKHFVYTTCSAIGIFMYWTGDSMNNLLWYCGLLDARMNAFDKDLPVLITVNNANLVSICKKKST